MVTKLIGVKEFRQNIAQLHKQARRYNWRYIVLSHNRPIFEVRPLYEGEAILEKLALDVAEAREDVKKGKVYTAAQARRRLGL